MDIPAKYSPKEIEDKWYSYWMENKFFHSEPDNREPYCIVIPPPNVTGVLHMGHMLNNTIQDVLVRRARMQGKNACWVPGTDHASIATEAKVVEKLAKEGVRKEDLSRDKFLEHAWEWTHKHGGIILEQLKKLGASCDWDRTAFTMDKILSESVYKVFTDLYNKGLIYRGVRMVNWDPKAQTAISDEEVNHKDNKGKLYYLKYKIVPEPVSGSKYATVATTRPETIFGDTALCINPNDTKNAHLKGKKVIVPLVNREVPVIEDNYIDIEFGTGCLKVTPAHDINDYKIGIKHNLEVIDVFNDNGTLNEYGLQFKDMDRFEVRKQIEKVLDDAGLLEKTEDYTNSVGFSERTDVPIEPKLSMQWFLKMEEISKPALKAVMDDIIQLHPPKFKNTYKHWMENVHDWCISRQLWWGHRIPAYYLEDGSYVIAETPEKALEQAKVKTGNSALSMESLRQDEDCLDTWFSSWLWPISVFDGINKPKNKEIEYYYPTNDLVTAPEILFFWVARMIIAGYEYRNDIPFRNVYLTGIVRDKQGRKMAKQLGNSPDPITLMEEYSADGVRMGMLLCSAAGNDILFDVSQVEQGRNFCNKIWNAFRLVRGWEVTDIIQPEHSKKSVEWFNNQLNKTITSINADFDKYRISEALMSLYKLFWDDFCGWYLEIIKPSFGAPIDKKTYNETLEFFDKLLKLLHPFMPFITEEIWHFIEEREKGESIMISPLPKEEVANNDIINAFDFVKQIISGVRNIRQEKNIALKEELELFVKGDCPKELESVIKKLTNVSKIEYISKSLDGTSGSFMVSTTEFFVPLGNLLDVEQELKKLEAELGYTKGFMNSVSKKLSNEKFVSGAPAQVVEAEKKKLADAQSKIKSIEEQIKRLKM